MTDIAVPAAPPQAQPHPEAPPHAIEVPDFQIVPRAGLAIAAVVLVALIVAIAVNKLWPLTFFHVAFGAAWTIIDLFLGFVLGPIMGQMPVPARIQFTTRLMPKMVVIMPIVVTATLAAGWQLGVHEGTVLTSYSAPWLGRGELHRGRRHVGARARPARAGQHRGAVRAEEAASRTRT